VSDDEQVSNITPIRPNLPEKATIGEKTRSGMLDRARRRHRILELRAAGLTEDHIAVELDMSRQAVSRIITQQLEEWSNDDKNNVENVRAMKLYELDQLKRAIWAKALRGDDKAVNSALKIIQAQAKIAGADQAPEAPPPPPPGAHGLDPAEIRRLEQAWLNSGQDVEKVVDAEVVQEVVQDELPLNITDPGEFN
jgi:hypothetical protein